MPCRVQAASAEGCVMMILNGNIFQKKGDHLSRKQRFEQNKDVFKTIGELEDNINDYDQDTTVTSSATHQILNIKLLQDLVNQAMTCRCSRDNELTNFINYCETHDNQLTIAEMRDLQGKWMAKKELEREVSINVQNIGIEPIVTICCPKCKQTSKITHEYTKYKDKNYNGKTHKLMNCSWFPSNLRLVLGTLATGSGASDTARLLSFLGLPNLQSFATHQFARIETLVGKHLRTIASASMKEAIELEGYLTKKEKNEDNNLRGFANTYDMGWNKRSSGNKYDSLSGHGLLIGCRSGKVIGALVTSKICSVCNGYF